MTSPIFPTCSIHGQFEYNPNCEECKQIQIEMKQMVKRIEKKLNATTTIQTDIKQSQSE